MSEIWNFSKSNTTEGEATKAHLGGKGFGLVQMARMGLPVPPGFIIPTSFCNFVANDTDGKNLETLINVVTPKVSTFIGVELGYQHDTYPMVSVRSGAPISMPGMMNTILNVGISRKTMTFWQNQIGDRAALDSYRRLIQMFGTTVNEISEKKFAAALKYVMGNAYGSHKPKSERDLSIIHLHKLVEKYEKIYAEEVGHEFPQTLEAQLAGAVGAVFHSWNGENAKDYRKQFGISDTLGTAVVIQAMVFGNRNNKSCSGVLFSRDSSSGEKNLYNSTSEFLPNAQGEDVVAGTATPLKLTEFKTWNPALAAELETLVGQLEVLKKDMVDVEFTVEDGKLYLLQVREGKPSAPAAFKIAYDLVQEGMITAQEALSRLTVEKYQKISRPIIDPAFTDKPIAVGLPGSKGIVTGKVWLSVGKAIANPGGILVSKETTPDDSKGMYASAGILTQTGGTTSHAAVVARNMDKVCVVGCTDLAVYGNAVSYKNGTINEGDEITIDGSTGNVYLGKVPMIGGTVPDYVKEMIEWGKDPSIQIEFEALNDTLPHTGEVVINCQNLNSLSEVSQLLTHLELDRAELTGVLNFAGSKPKFDDSKFLIPLGIQPAVKSLSLKQTIALNNMKQPVAQRWVVMGKPSNSTKALFPLPKQLKTLKDFLDCDGYYELTPELAKVLAEQGVTVEQLATILKNSGKNVRCVTKTITRSELAYKVLGK